MSDATRIWVVDRVEGRRIVLVDDDTGARIDVAAGALSFRAREGDVLRVPTGAAGAPDWRSAAVDEAARRARLEEAENALRELRARDPGGDVEL